MNIQIILYLLATTSIAVGLPKKCDQTPPGTQELTPRENKNVPHVLEIITKGKNGTYLPGQTYVLILKTMNVSRPFQQFMITVEDPDVDKSSNEFLDVDVGSLKTLDEDAKSRYSERCSSSVENADNSNKERIEIHWLSPKKSEENQRIRFRAMVAENKESWYTDGNLTIVLGKDDDTPLDSPPYKPVEVCDLCSEARYEVIFKGRWSRGSHPRHYPSKPDDNGYSHMVGASHGNGFTLWRQNTNASEGLRKLVEDADTTFIEKEIINKMSDIGGTRTLIRGKMRQHPYMSEPSSSLFRVDREHHMFSIAVGIRPSPDWFLGATMFELCTNIGWLSYSEIPLYPWDAGTMDGISYDSHRSMTQPVDNIDRVAVGSFDKDSPFYQMNLNDLKPFALLEVRRLDVYPLEGIDCSDNEGMKYTQTNNEENTENSNEPADAPLLAESRLEQNGRCLSQWSDWSECAVDEGTCAGTQVRVRYEEVRSPSYDSDPNNSQAMPLQRCERNRDESLLERRICTVDC